MDSRLRQITARLDTAWEEELESIRVLGGPGRLGTLKDLVAARKSRSVLIVTDRGVAAAGHVARASRSLASISEVWVFDGVGENPSSIHVKSGSAFAREHGIDLIVALGGGSAMDCAKGINFLYSNGGKIEDYWGFGKATRPLLPSIGIPSTCGTGSEAQSYALITDAETGRKMACGDPKARFVTVILDPEVAATTPRAVAARAGLDAVSHCVESFVCKKANARSRQLATQGWRLLENELLGALDHPRNQEALAAVSRLQLAAFLAGAAVEASMLGAAHAAANPLTAVHGVVHGDAVALMLPATVRFNAALSPDPYLALEPGGGKALADRIDALRRGAGLPERLRDCGISRPDLPKLAELATQEWTGGFNPRPVGRAEFQELYEAVF